LLISLASTVAFIVIVALIVRSTPGWPRVRDSFFDWARAGQVLPGLIKALWINIQIMAISEVFILIFAAGLALIRTLQGPVFFPLRLAPRRSTSTSSAACRSSSSSTSSATACRGCGCTAPRPARSCSASSRWC
jgi:hypothetical protein